MDELHQRLADRIRELSEERGIAVTNLPDHADIGRSHFWGVMAGRSSPTLAWLARLAAALEVDPSELIAPPKGKGRR